MKLTKTSIMPNCQVPNSFFGIIYRFATHHTALRKKTLLLYLSAWDRSRDSTAKRNLSKDMQRTLDISGTSPDPYKIKSCYKYAEVLIQVIYFCLAEKKMYNKRKFLVCFDVEKKSLMILEIFKVQVPIWQCLT